MNVLLWIGVALVVLWLVVWLAFEVVGAIVHVLLLLAVALIVWGLVKRGVRAVGR